MDSPQNHIWGPNLWLILHSSAERIGSKQLQKLPQEESRIWINILSSLRFSLPCPLCKKHYTAYFSSHPITSVSREFIRNWLFNLHNQINTQNSKQNNISLESIPEIYGKPFHFSSNVSVVSEQMTKGLRIGISSHNDVQKTLRAFQELKRFYDFF